MNKNGYFITGIVRAIVRIGIEIIHRVLIHIFDFLFGFLNWPQKKLRIKIFILQKQEGDPVLLPPDINDAIEYAKRVFKRNFNVDLLPCSSNRFVEVLQTISLKEVLYTKGGTGAMKEEFSITGSFFSSHLGGKIYPITAFVVVSIKGATGCSLGPMTDYITLDPNGAINSSVLAHELTHACGLWHIKDSANLLYPNNKRGDQIRWWQKNIFRSSRHVTYW